MNTSTSLGDRPDKFAIFEEWLLQNGASFRQLELRSYDDDNDNDNDNDNAIPSSRDGGTCSSSSSSSYSAEEKKETKEKNNHTDVIGNSKYDEESEMRGVHAKTNIPTDTICVAIPKRCLITVEMGQATEIGQIILQSDVDLDAPKHIFLMIFLLWDRKTNGNDSFFKPYYDILPKTLSNIPIFWSDKELEYLDGSYLLTQIEDRIEAITEDYHAICQVAPQLLQIATLDEFKWARMCVCSRNFGLQIDGHRTSALVPHADMLNHHRPRETKWSFDDQLQSFTITTLQPIRAGAQVFDSYGQKCNHRFLLNYGFAVEDNQELDGFCPNEVPIELSISPDDSLYEARYDFWMRGESDNSNSCGPFGGVSTNQALNAVLAAAAAGAAGRLSHTTSSMATTSTTSTAPSVNSVNTALAVAPDPPIDTHVNIPIPSPTLKVPEQAPTPTPAPTGGDTRKTTMKNDDSSNSAKRVRVCVSSNENTRILFSMLRVLAANEDDLRAMATSPTLPYGDSGCSMYLSRALRGYAANNPDNPAFVSMQHAALYRTCRDIRNPISLQNEKGTMQLLLQVVASALDLYPTSLPQDVSDLMDDVAYLQFSNKRHAKIQVRGEKEVLHHFAHWAQTALEVIEVIEREIAVESRQIIAGSADARVSGPGFDVIMRSMADDDSLHFTIVRYCGDVLGALWKDAIQSIRRGRDPFKSL